MKTIDPNDLSTEQRDLLDELFEKIAPNRYLKLIDTDLGDGWTVEPYQYRGLILIDPDGEQSYHVSVYEPEIRFDGQWINAHIGWPSFSDKPGAAEARKFAALVEIAAGYAEYLDAAAAAIAA